MGQQKDKKNLKDLEMAKKRNHKIMITEEAIKKVPRIQYKNIPEKEYAYEKAVVLFNEAVDVNNEARGLKGLQKAADCFLKVCKVAEIFSKQGLGMEIKRDFYLNKLISRKHNRLVKVINTKGCRSICCMVGFR